MNAKNTSSFEHELPELERRETSVGVQNSFSESSQTQKNTSLKVLLIAGAVIALLFLVWSFLHRGKVPSEGNSSFSSSLESFSPISKEGGTSSDLPIPEEVLENKDKAKESDQNALKLQEERERVEERLRVLETDGRLASLKSEVDELSRRDGSTLKAEILKQVDRRLSVIEGELSKLQKVGQASLSELPFKVVAVDLWDSRPFVAVSVESKTKLVGVGDTVMGWEVGDIQFQKQEVIFKKDGEQKVVSVQ
ncbi:MAG: hypothetical protein HY559_01695 [Gammaproteobacteria bacterium]|nr:hypothetical protein [Gammaproteobacteria bacterium]